MRRHDRIEVPLPGEELVLRRLVLDLNGTLTRDGHLESGVAPRIARLAGMLSVVAASGDTFGTAAAVADQLRIPLTRLAPEDQGEQKLRLVQRLGADSVVMIGNGRNDAPALRAARLGILVLGPEGAAVEAMAAADVLARDAVSALDLLLEPRRLVATLRR